MGKVIANLKEGDTVYEIHHNSGNISPLKVLRIEKELFSAEIYLEGKFKPLYGAMNDMLMALSTDTIIFINKEDLYKEICRRQKCVKNAFKKYMEVTNG